MTRFAFDGIDRLRDRRNLAVRAWPRPGRALTPFLGVDNVAALQDEVVQFLRLGSVQAQAISKQMRRIVENASIPVMKPTRRNLLAKGGAAAGALGLAASPRPHKLQANRSRRSIWTDGKQSRQTAVQPRGHLREPGVHFRHRGPLRGRHQGPHRPCARADEGAARRGRIRDGKGPEGQRLPERHQRLARR